MRRPCMLTIMLAAGVSTGANAADPPPPAAEAPTIVSTPVARTDRTSSNQPLKIPSSNAEVVATVVEIPVGGSTSIHQHRWSRFAYVEAGHLTVINHDTGETREFQPGGFISEAVGQWHEGRASVAPVRLIVIDILPKGEGNTVAMPGAEP